MKAVLRGKFIALSYSKKKPRREHLLELNSTPECSRQNKANSPQSTRRQEIINLRAEIKPVETKGFIQRIKKTRSWFFEKINKTRENP